MSSPLHELLAALGPLPERTTRVVFAECSNVVQAEEWCAAMRGLGADVARTEWMPRMKDGKPADGMAWHGVASIKLSDGEFAMLTGQLAPPQVEPIKRSNVYLTRRRPYAPAGSVSSEMIDRANAAMSAAVLGQSLTREAEEWGRPFYASLATTPQPGYLTRHGLDPAPVHVVTTETEADELLGPVDGGLVKDALRMASEGGVLVLPKDVEKT